ncbi:hypothetical protein BDP81DRAFT_458186 [Colletotrichum phormii]|uniref:Alcohol dehydrogenase 2 n=1 Tax=Colletotrichum phormii TaxID=359342 RepID=A0AAJ0ELU1_9PEZI|nr:uncharacterized protein BDP81DRAFT_458186 [Colletotrichum phormii]KAK1641381.1 hypothetical protein BDP81DRAFT_458186 [Colletotrichum phormii]
MDSERELEIPAVQKAVIFENPGPDARIVVRDDVPVGTPGPYEVLVRLWWHEGVGSVVKLGEHVPETLLRRRVGVKWLYRACGECSVCARGFSNNCPKQLNTGKHRPGTLQNYVVADSRYLTLIPERLSSADATPFLCAGLTMMGALSMLDNESSPGDWVVIQGSGGGLGHLGVQIAKKMKHLRVIAIDTGSKSNWGKSMTDAYFDYKTDDLEKFVMDLTGEGAHAVIVVPGSEDAYRVAPKLVRSMGTIFCVGLPRNDFEIPISVAQCALKALTIRGAMVGTEEQMTQLLLAAEKGIIRPNCDYCSFHDVHKVMDELESGEILGRTVVSCL